MVSVFEHFLESLKLPIQQRFNPSRVFSDSEQMKCGLSPLLRLFISSSTSFSSSPRPHPLCPSVSSLSSFTSPDSHSSPTQKNPLSPPPPSLFRSSAGPVDPCWVKWTMPVSQEPRVPRLAQPGSAQLSVLNLLCDYCQSETPPPGRSVMMGTIWHRAQPAMKAGIREQKRYRNPGRGKDTEAGEKYC